MRILIVTYGMQSWNQHLLPWIYIKNLNEHFNKIAGFSSSILNLNSTYECESKKIICLTDSAKKNYDVVFYPIDWSLKSFTLPIRSDRKIAYFPGSIFRLRDYLGAFRLYEVKKIAQYGLHLLNRKLLEAGIGQLPDDTDQIICFSRFNAEYLSSRLPGAKISVAPPFHNSDEIDTIRHAVSNSRRNDYFLFCGSPFSERGFFDLLKLKAILSQNSDGPVIKFLIRVDENVNHHKTRKICKKFECSNFIFEFNEVRREKLLSEIALCQALLLPFRVVPCEVPLAAYECYALGNLVISTNVNGFSMLNSDLGINIPESNPQLMVDAMKFILENPKDAQAMRNASELFIKESKGWDAFNTFFEDICRSSVVH